LVTDGNVYDGDPGEDPLGILGVIERLEIGPPTIEKRRITAPYTITRNGETHTTELLYRFEEDAFTPGDRDSMNLASMISAQVGLNYGLFCDEIIFNGLFDDMDRGFIREMAKNTAREIFVKKILEDNPFVRTDIQGIPSIKQRSYLRANIIFRDIDGGPFHDSKDQSAAPWEPQSDRYAVLSSGGKDSLLSFGLLKELGYECHPIFLNESGRHWFTALNAYRHFQKNTPNTVRVWTNSDRVFSWMLRHLPFIRKDFANIRADEYPIRLWTVAVFLFGALPILKKRKIGRLVIGDEFDTTRRLSHKGIKHYDGLYDQSRYFDDALTRYFHRKRWGITQFSILRPLSELLIEKILLERYPDLQHLQISCHAAHKGEDRVIPCGQCEKCRRIVGMLMALNGDPAHCGYTPEQLDRCMKDLVRKGVHQERSDLEHLGYLLMEKGLMEKPFVGAVKVRQRDSVMKLRFDPDRSPLEGIPVDLRRPLYRIYLEYASGSVKRRGRTWIDFDIMVDPALNRPYPFDPSQGRTPMGRHQSEYMVHHEKDHSLGELTWPEAEKRFKEVDVALLPVGAIEQHGPHLPLDSDAFDADYLARRVVESCKDPKPFVLPLIPYGVSYHHEDFSGTISISPQTLSQIVYDIGMSAVRHGITKLVIINGHGGNSPALHFAAQMINRDAHIFTCVDTGETSDPDIYAMVETPNDVHAGEIETSTALATRPHLVRPGKGRKFIPRFSNRYLDFTSKRSVGWYAHTSKISPLGILGDPTRATREKGERMWQVMVDRLVEFVEDLKGLSLDEIYQKRY
jgi:creatinine amidohydrolase/Fe(II)-dependent formamide hydrolase-like protein